MTNDDRILEIGMRIEPASVQGYIVAPTYRHNDGFADIRFAGSLSECLAFVEKVFTERANRNRAETAPAKDIAQ